MNRERILETRMERVMRLVKLGPQITDPHNRPIPGAYALLVEGRPVYGTKEFFMPKGGHKTMVLSMTHSERGSGIDQFMTRHSTFGYWRPLHPKLEAMIMLSLMGQY